MQLATHAADAAGSSSIVPSQLSSIPLHTASAAGLMLGSSSLQSTGPQSPPSGAKPSWSASVQRGEARSPKRWSKGVGQLRQKGTEAVVSPVAGLSVNNASRTPEDASKAPP